jgi:hypothetical protein
MKAPTPVGRPAGRPATARAMRDPGRHLHPSAPVRAAVDAGRGGRTTVVLTAIVLTGALALVSAGPASGAPRPGNAVGLDGPTVTPVDFAVAAAPPGNFSVAVDLSATVALSGGSVSPGQSIWENATVTTPRELDLRITFQGVPTVVPVAALGGSVEVPIPGIALNLSGVAFGVVVNFTGTIVASTVVLGPATGGGEALRWGTDGTQSFRVSANATTLPARSIDAGLTGIQYVVGLGIDAVGVLPVVGPSVIPLVEFGTIGAVNGTPASALVTLEVPAPSAGLTWDSPPGAMLVLGVALGAAAAAGGAALWWWRRAPPTRS